METFFQGNSGLLLLMVLWTIPWKGVALWKSAKLSHKKWFIVILVLNTLAILDILYIFIFSKKQAKIAVGNILSTAQRYRSAQAKKEIQDKIKEFIDRRGRVANNDIQELLGVSDSTATRYLDELEQEGVIIQHGGVGRGVFYVLKNGSNSP